MSIYLYKLAYVQVIINFPFSVAQMCTGKDTLAHYLGTPSLDDVLNHNELTTPVFMRQTRKTNKAILAAKQYLKVV